MELEFIFQQDNAPLHTAQSVLNWINNPTPEFLLADGENWNFELMVWPAQSPYLNPIEHLCDHIERELARGDPPHGINGLWQRVKDIWNNIDPQVFQILVDSMPSRCQKVIDARGGYTPY